MNFWPTVLAVFIGGMLLEGAHTLYDALFGDEGDES